MTTKDKLNKLALLILLLGFTAQAQAHKVNMFAFVEGNEIFIEGYFADGKKPKDGKITVFDSNDVIIHQGLTDIEGSYTFAIPAQDALRILLNVGMGHQTEYTIPKEEVTGISDDTNNDDQVSTSTTTNTINAAPVSSMAIKKAVGEAMRPLMRSIDELKSRRGFSDIIGGVGFIIGLIGLFFYYKARQMLAAAKTNKGQE